MLRKQKPPKIPAAMQYLRDGWNAYKGSPAKIAAQYSVRGTPFAGIQAGGLRLKTGMSEDEPTGMLSCVPSNEIQIGCHCCCSFLLSGYWLPVTLSAGSRIRKE